MVKILVVVDMQNDFVTGALKNPAAEAIIPKVTKKIEAESMNGSTIVFTQDSHNPEYLSSEEGKHLPVEHCIAGSDGWEIIKDLQPYVKQTFCKNTFGSALLFEYLCNCQPDVVELIGVCTDICVISNAVIAKTAVPNAHIIVDASCCAGVTKESHQTALDAMKALQIEVIGEESI